MNILILTGKFGMGHWSASESLQQQLQKAFPQAGVDVVDFVAYAMPNSSEAVYKGFNLLVTHGSGLFNTYYKWTENAPSQAGMLFEGIFLDRLGDLLEERRPQVVIATHPLCAKLMSRWKWECDSDLPLITCLTDICAHSEWIHTGTDGYLVGSPGLRDKLAAKGVARERIWVTGIPVRAEFKRSSRRAPGGPRRLLIMGGGLGLLPKRDRFYEELDALPGVETTLIAGNNKKLLERLEGRYTHIRVLGYTDRVYDYMARSDLMLSKPGGITLFETIFSELPILAWEPFLQQEKNNARFLTRTGIGRVAPKEPEACLKAIRSLIYDGEALARMRQHMQRLKGELEEESLNRIVAAMSRTQREGVRV